MSNNIIKSLTDILDNKAPATDGISSLKKNNALESSILFSLYNRGQTITSSLQLLNDSFNINVNNKNILKSTNDTVIFPYGIITNNITSNNTLNINSKYINLKGTVNIYGSTNLVNNIYTNLKLIELNLNELKEPIDSGGLSGIIIKSTNINKDGYIMTNSNADRFIVKAPLNSQEQIMATLDQNSNFHISGSSTINTDLYVSGISYLNILNVSSLATITNINTNNLYVSNNTILDGKTTILSSLNISGTSIINNIHTNYLYVSSNSILNGNISINNLTVSGVTNIFKYVNMNMLNVSGKTILNDTTINGNLYISNYSKLNNVYANNLNISNNSIFLGYTTILGNLNISGNSILNDTTINNLFVSSSSIFNNLLLNNTLTVSGNTNLNNVTIQNSLYVSGFANLNNINCNNINISNSCNILIIYMFQIIVY